MYTLKEILFFRCCLNMVDSVSRTYTKKNRAINIYHVVLSLFFVLSIVLYKWRTFTRIFFSHYSLSDWCCFLLSSSFVSITPTWIFGDRSQRIIELVRKKVIDNFPNRHINSTMQVVACGFFLFFIIIIIIYLHSERKEERKNSYRSKGKVILIF